MKPLFRAAARRLAAPRGQSAITVWLVVLLVSGQGFRYLIGLPAFAVLAVLTIVAVGVSFRPTWRDLRPPLLVGAFVGLATLSVLWSSSRLVTLVAALLMAATTFVAIVTARGSTATEFMVRLFRGLQISLAIGIVFELFIAVLFLGTVSPAVNDLVALGGDAGGVKFVAWSDGLLFQGGPIQGFVGNRNPFGAIAITLAIVTFILMMERRIGKVEGWITLGAAIFVHLFTQSATVTAAAVYLVALTLGALAIRRVSFRWKRVLSFSILAVSAVGAILTIRFSEAIFTALGRDSDLTSRTEIWEDVLDYAVQRPEGWGFVGYWPIWQYPYSEIGTEVKWVRPTHAHNAFLDVWLQLGLIGLVLLVAMVLLLFGSTWRLVERAGTGDTYIPLGWALLTVFLSMQALTESRLLVESGWYLLVALYCLGPPVFRLTIVDPEMVHSGVRRKDRRIAGKVTVFSGVDHVMLAMPPGSQDSARQFYGEVLGMVEMDCPEPMRSQGGCCFETGDVVLHLGAADDFVPATMAHPAIMVEDLDALQAALEEHGYACRRSESAHPGIERFHTRDIFGNRLEFQQA
ncbi:O-antigen ligase family protein [Demequina sp. NBRC 110056]|uniref:O-antigen ligase family protein n=1 Tax=Demequina sp. NBRC 110056 TaxID=1570345 RepID=UPI000A013010|nr:O-antigen ligase family protein [Demequina sp. NBRC 110056]